MSEAKQVKRSPFIIKRLTHCLTALVLLCVYSGSLHLSGAGISAASNEVFCPLQKTWVKKYPEAAPTEKQKEPLKDLCARDERKTDFLWEFNESLRLTRATQNGAETEKLFFAYFAEGKPALAHYISSQNIPEPQFISSVRTEQSANNSRIVFAENAVEINRPALSPPAAASAGNFVSQTFTELKNISRHIKPRAPPVFI